MRRDKKKRKIKRETTNIMTKRAMMKTKMEAAAAGMGTQTTAMIAMTQMKASAAAARRKSLTG